MADGLRHRPVADRHGRQVHRHRGHGRRRDHDHPRQRQHADRRDGPPGQAPAPQVEVPGRLRLVRQRGLHPRPRQPVEPQADPRHRLLDVQHGQPGRHPPGLRVPGAGRASCTCPSSSRCCGRSTRSWTWTTRSPAARPSRSRSGPPCRRSWPALNGTGPLPPKGSVLGAGDSTVCDECARKRDVKKIDQLRPHPAGRSVRPGDLPAGAGPALQRPGDPQRLRRPLPGRRARRASAATARPRVSSTTAPA